MMYGYGGTMMWGWGWGSLFGLLLCVLIVAVFVKYLFFGRR